MAWLTAQTQNVFSYGRLSMARESGVSFSRMINRAGNVLSSCRTRMLTFPRLNAIASSLILLPLTRALDHGSRSLSAQTVSATPDSVRFAVQQDGTIPVVLTEERHLHDSLAYDGWPIIGAS